MATANPFDSLVVKRKRQTPNGEDDLIESHSLTKLYNAALTRLRPSNYARNVAGDVRLYKGERWQVAPIADWPADRGYAFGDVTEDQLRAAFTLQPGSASIPQAHKGEPVTVSEPLAAAPEQGLEQASGERRKIKIKLKR